MTERNFCYQCLNLKSVNQLTGEKIEFGFGSCHIGPYYIYPKLLQPVDEVESFEVKPCPHFKKRTPQEISAIEKWMDKHGITAYVRSMA